MLTTFYVINENRMNHAVFHKRYVCHFPTESRVAVAMNHHVQNRENHSPGKVVFDDPNGLKLFTVHPGQSTLSLKLNIPAFLAAYETQFTCQVGCGTNDPTKNCVIAPFNESAFRSAFLANLTIE